MNTVFFRDKTASLDIVHAQAVRYWDNNVEAHHMVPGSVVIITPMKSNYPTREDWLNATALLGTYSGEYEKLNTDTGEWPSNPEGGYVHRYHFQYVSGGFRVRDMIPTNMNHVDALRQGSVSYRN